MNAPGVALTVQIPKDPTTAPVSLDISGMALNVKVCCYADFFSTFFLRGGRRRDRTMKANILAEPLKKKYLTNKY